MCDTKCEHIYVCVRGKRDGMDACVLASLGVSAHMRVYLCVLLVCVCVWACSTLCCGPKH